MTLNRRPREGANLYPHLCNKFWGMGSDVAIGRIAGGIMCELELVDDEYCIGEFGDKRLCRTGKLLHSRMMEHQTVCLRRLGEDWRTEKRLGRFLSNRDVTRQEIMRYGCSRTAERVAGLHVLAIQD